MPLRASPPRPASWRMVETELSSAGKNAKCQTPQRGRRRGDTISGRGTLATLRGLQPGRIRSVSGLRWVPSAAGARLLLAQLQKWGVRSRPEATQCHAIGRGWHVTRPIRTGVPSLGARTFPPKDRPCADTSSPLRALTRSHCPHSDVGVPGVGAAGAPAQGHKAGEGPGRSPPPELPAASKLSARPQVAAPSPVCRGAQGGTRQALAQRRPGLARSGTFT